MTVETSEAQARPNSATSRLRGATHYRPVWLTRPILVDVGLTFLVTKILFYGAMLIAVLAIPKYSGHDYQPWQAPVWSVIANSWRWDSGWYASIIQHGYTLTPGENSIAFFPLFPMLVRIAVGPFSIHWMFVAGVIVTNAALFFALIAVWLYAESYGGRPLARRVLFLLAIFPASFFFSVAYSESVFLLVVAWSLWMLRRGRFAGAGVAGFFAALARPPGLYVGIPFVIEAWQQRGSTWPDLARKLSWILLLPAGLSTFMIYLWWKFGDPFLFLTAQGAWNHGRQSPLSSVIQAIRQIFLADGTRIAQFMNVVNTSAGVLALVLGLALLRRNLAGGLFVLAGVLAPLTFPITGAPSISLARYVVVLFPMFIPLARWAKGKPALIGLAILFIPLQMLLAGLFIQWYWVI